MHKYSRVATGQDAVEVMSMIDLGLVKKGMLRYVHHVRGVIEIYERRGLKVNANKSKGTVLEWEER